MDRKDEAARNRAAMPQFAAWLDELRRVFGPVRVLWAREGGVEVGRRPEVRADAGRRPGRSSGGGEG